MNSCESPGLYVHVPFCRRKCPYCDFYSIPASPDLIRTWLAAVLREARLYRDRFAAFDSLYLGGGTPSLLGEGEIEALLTGLVEQCRFTAQPEITLEVNPDDVTAEKAAFWHQLGINRCSIGAQSFDPAQLAWLERRHTVQQTQRAWHWLRRAGFSNLAMDLIYGLPGQTAANWRQSLESATALAPEHLSCYQLTLAADTPFRRLQDQGRITPLRDEAQADLYLLTSRHLTRHGYLHYEVSNYARDPGHRSRHNCKYWHHVPYLGLGPGAHSYRDGRRWWNVRSVPDYCRRLGDGQRPLAATETLSAEQMRLETLYLGFRTRQGVALETLYGFANGRQVLDELLQAELVQIIGDRAIPTTAGFLVADSLPLLFEDGAAGPGVQR